jgi:lipoprotein-anchoring transpeptidase ErfK/SrfK
MADAPRRRRARRGLALSLALSAALGAPATAAPPPDEPSPKPPAPAPATVAPTQELAGIARPHFAYAQPSAASRRLRRVPARTPVTGARTVLPVIGHAVDAAGRPWLHVRLPGRPTGSSGWIAQRGTVASSARWHLVVSVATRRVVAFRDGRRVRSFGAIVGKRSTPTPRGSFFVEEAVRLHRRAAGAPFALATSARSEVLQEFAGGPGQIALHGVRNIGGRLGSAVSHGCVRLSTRAITWLVRRVDAGTPLTIR